MRGRGRERNGKGEGWGGKRVGAKGERIREGRIGGREEGGKGGRKKE